MPFDGTNLSQTKRDLIAARELLVRYGKARKCGFYRVEGPHCIMTAITMACDFNHRFYDAGDVLCRTLGPDTHYTELVQFSDSHKSADPILALFDKAIANA